MIKVLVVDDHQLVIDGIISLLGDAENISCQHGVNSGQEALGIIHKEPFDVVLLDIGIPDMDGIKTCELIHDQFPDVKIIALTMLSERSMIKAMLEAGASGYLLKNVDFQELEMAVNRVYSGKKHYSEEIAEILIKPEPKKESEEQPDFALSRREKEILKLMVYENTTSQIAEQLFISVNTVDTHRKNIMQKLGAKNLAGIVRKAIEFKLINDDQE
ncbi:MAG: response regulator transcription factor [Saprospiraceae bacterium]|nr:response regulator transcription factor [Saprospiraceae bacterium]